VGFLEGIDSREDIEHTVKSIAPMPVSPTPQATRRSSHGIE
jgi:hypothetical protein